MSTAPHLWRLITLARAERARGSSWSTRSAAAPRGVADQHLRAAAGHATARWRSAILRALLDAGLADEAWCRAHAVGYDDLVARLGDYPVERCAGLCDVAAETIRALARDIATTQPSLIRLGVGAQRHAGAPIAYRTVACIPALAGSWRAPRRRAARTSRARRPNALDTGVARRGRRSQRGTPRAINMSQLGEALTDAALDPPVDGAGRAGLEPGRDRARPGAGAARVSRREDLLTVVLEQFMTDTARYADVVLPATMQLEHLDAALVVGPPLPDAATSPRSRRSASAMPNTRDLPAAGAPGSGSTTRRSARQRRGDARRAARRGAGLDRRDRAARARVHEDRPRPGRAAARGRRLRRRRRAGSSCAPTRSPSAGIDPLPHYDPPAEVADAALAARLPLALRDAEDAPVPQLDLRERRPPARGAAGAARLPARG